MYNESDSGPKGCETMKKLLLTLLLALCCGACARADRFILPGDVLIIEAQAFYGDQGLTDVVLPEGLQRIESKAFIGTGLQVVTLPSHLSFIAGDAFDETVRFRVTPNTYAAEWAAGRIVEDAAMPEGVAWEILTDADGTAYAVITGYTGSETELVLPDAIPDGTVIREIGEAAFSGAQFTAVTLPGQLKVVGDDAFSHCTELTEISLPATVTTIERDAFNDCTALRRVNIPDTVAAIGPWAFANCENVTAVTLPAGMTAFGTSAFANCGNLREITLSADADTTDVFMNDPRIETIHYLCGPSGTLSAWTGSNLQRVEWACADSLRTVDIGEGITAVGAGVFGNESFHRLTTVHLPDTLRTIGESAFANLSALTSVNFPTGLESVGDYAFSLCVSLTRPELPAGVTVGEYAFDGCPAPQEPEE